MRLSYISRLQSQGVEVYKPSEGEYVIPNRVRSILQSKFYKRPKSAIKGAKQQTQKSESFWVSPLKNKDAPEVIHRNKSQPKKNFYVISVNEITKKKRNSSITPSKLKINHQIDTSQDQIEKNIIQGISKSLTNKYSTPKCRVFTEPEQIDNNNDSFLDVLQYKTGIQILKESLLNIYQALPFELNITQQRELVRRIVLQETHLIEKKNQQTQEWVNKMSPILKKQLMEDKTFWYPSTKLNYNIIKKDINQIFGVGSSRLLQPGEEASIIELMIQILESNQNILKILKTDIQDICKQILQFQQLEYLQQYPQCMKQILYHWQLFVTRLLCIQVQKENNQITNQDLIILCKRNHALDFRQDKQNTLATMLLNYLQS
ncbi:unnamed protein product [Paramecium pentaurelia]|uniref:Uncharacterized protein n=1 Tax=Paramecium pentaurelia TaxID=43138 RepID=A0A8S1W5E2_9CILI|nr:unnamed protein product [Paramecium pentaurelia]